MEKSQEETLQQKLFKALNGCRTHRTHTFARKQILESNKSCIFISSIRSFNFINSLILRVVVNPVNVLGTLSERQECTPWMGCRTHSHLDASCKCTDWHVLLGGNLRELELNQAQTQDPATYCAK